MEKKRLRDIIQAQMVLPENYRLRFLPETTLKQLLGKQEVTKALEKSGSSLQTDISMLTSFVSEKATRLFAILAWSNDEHLIDQFYQRRFGDDHLPIEWSYDKDNGFAKVSLQTDNGGPINHHPFNNHQCCNDIWLDNFCSNYQWLFLSPVFSESQFRYVFPSSMRMPFVDLLPISQKESFFSVVQQQRIHRGHLPTNYIHLPEDPEDHPALPSKNSNRCR
jgi:hypothetical protein